MALCGGKGTPSVTNGEFSQWSFLLTWIKGRETSHDVDDFEIADNELKRRSPKEFICSGNPQRRGTTTMEEGIDTM